MDGNPPRPARRLLGAMLVSGQAALFGGLVLTPTRDDWPVPPVVRTAGDVLTAAGVAGMVVAGASLGRGLTASPLPHRAARLRTGGLYAHVRHPIYSALLLVAAGRVVVSGSLVRATLMVALLALLTGKARWEEQLLAERFPDYPGYAAFVPRFVPRPFRRRSGPD